MEKVEVDISDGVVYFMFRWPEDEVFTDEGQPGLMTGFDGQTDEIIGYMTVNLPRLYKRIIAGLRKQPIPGRFTITAVHDETGRRPCTGLTNLTFAQVVRWVYETHFAAPQPAVTLQPALAVREPPAGYDTDDEESP